VAWTCARKSITAKTRAEDDCLKEARKHADGSKLKKLMAPLITSVSDKKHPQKKSWFDRLFRECGRLSLSYSETSVYRLDDGRCD
jgi:hypothetical protein